MTLDFERARFNMVEQQVRPWEVLDARVLEVLTRIRREDYVPTRYRKLAFADVSIPLDHQQQMMTPVVEGRLLQALQIKTTDSVLEVGTGSGFVTACLAGLADQVMSIDIFSDFVERAHQRTQANGIANIKFDVGDVVRGWNPGRSFDVICVTGAVHRVPDVFVQNLRVGGRLFIIRGIAPAMEAMLITRETESNYREESLFETELGYLLNAAPPVVFSLD